jgi:glucoamylase
LMPEQVWDEPDRPDTSLKIGAPAGSAVPLVWAHAEYLKLLRSAVDGKVFDRIEAVYQRYSEPAGRSRLHNHLEIYSLHRPIQKIAAGDTLRILDEAKFDVIWSCDGWKTRQSVPSRSLGSAGYAVDIHPKREAGSQGSGLSWTLHWPEQDRWLGSNVEIAIEAK